MGFKRSISFKKIFSLVAVLSLLGTNLLMAQGAAEPSSVAPADNSKMWMGAAYYALLFLILCFVIAIVGKILRVYDLTQKVQGKKEIN